MKFVNNIDGWNSLAFALQMNVWLFVGVCGCGRDEVERFGLFQRYLHEFVNMNNQHVSNQTACFISGSCRMFLRWFLMFLEFLQQVQMGLEMDVTSLR